MKPKFRTCGALLGSAVLFFSVSQTRAADGTWSVDDNGAWSEDVKWTSSVIADGAGFTANFTNDQTADATITLDTPRSIGHLVFGDADTGTACSWLLTGSVLTLDATTPSITVDNLASGASATISTVLAGTAGLTKLGSGSLVLSGLNTYTGLTTATAGTLTISGNAIKTGILVNGGTMNVQAGNTMSGGITVDSGELTLSGANTFSAGTTINGGTVTSTVSLLKGTGGTGTATVTLNGGTLDMSGTNIGAATDTVVLAAQSGTLRNVGEVNNGAGWTKSTGGTLTLAGTNTYSGNTYVHGGVLRLNSANAVPGGIGNSGGTSALIVEGGVIGLGLSDFTRSLGSGAAQVQFKGNGGFAFSVADFPSRWPTVGLSHH